MATEFRVGTQAGGTGRPAREVEVPATGGGAGNRTRRPDPAATGARAKLIAGLFPPVREIVLAVDEVKAAWNARDMDRLGRAIRRADARVTDYIEQVEA